MTTIATDGKSMAADGLETDDEVIVGFAVQKIYRLSDGRLMGAAGDSGVIERFLQWLEDGEPEDEKPEFDKDEDALTALVLGEDGLFFYDESLRPSASEVPAAIGHGRDFALAAMDLGHPPAKAIEAAAKRSVFTGGDISVEVL